MAQDNVSVVVEPEAKEEAYRMGYERFSHEPSEELDEMWFEHYTETAEWANSKLPSLRCMAGANDPMGHGTYTEHTEIVVVEYPDDRPMQGKKVDSHHLFHELADMFRRGAEDKVRGEDFGYSMEW